MTQILKTHSIPSADEPLFQLHLMRPQKHRTPSDIYVQLQAIQTNTIITLNIKDAWLVVDLLHLPSSWEKIYVQQTKHGPTTITTQKRNINLHSTVPPLTVHTHFSFNNIIPQSLDLIKDGHQITIPKDHIRQLLKTLYRLLSTLYKYS